MVFLAELQRLAVVVRHELARRETLTIGQGTQGGVVVAARLL